MNNKIKWTLVLGVFCALIKPVSAQNSAAQNGNIEKELRVPLSVVSNDPAGHDKLIEFRRKQKQLIAAEKVRQWLMEPDNAAIARDRLGSPSRMHRMAEYLTKENTLWLLKVLIGIKEK